MTATTGPTRQHGGPPEPSGARRSQPKGRVVQVAVVTALVVVAALVAHVRAATSADQQGCTLAVGGSLVTLSVVEAMALTDIAGADQTAARTDAQTAAAVAKALPAQASNAPAIAGALHGYAVGRSSAPPL